MALKINRLISAYNSSSRSGNTVKYIVIHYVGGVSSAYNNVKYFSGGDRQASAHFFVGHEGEIWQSVEESRSAWHCGGGLQGSGGHAWHGKCKNANSIGIEMCVRKDGNGKWYFEDATVNSTIELTKHLMKKYGVPASNVIRHYDVTGKICPAPYVHNNTEHTWTAFKNALTGSYEKVETPTSTPTDNKLVVDGFWGKKTTTRLQQIFGTTVDGIISNQWAMYKVKNKGLEASTFDWQSKPNGKGSQLIRAMQKWAGMKDSECDGEIGTDTIKAFQKKLGTTVDGYVSAPSDMVKALQTWANNQK